MTKKVSTWIYTIFQPIAAFLIKVVYQPKIINKEVIPKEGSVILAGNHKMAFDPVLVTCGTKRLVHFMANDVFFHRNKRIFYEKLWHFTSSCRKSS